MAHKHQTVKFNVFLKHAFQKIFKFAEMMGF